MREAIALSLANVREGKGGPFAAIVVKDNAVLARGTNLVTSTNDPTAHAEIVAIREACRTLGSFQLSGCDIYTSCEPCPMCMGAIYWARPRAVFFANTRDDAAAIGFDDRFIYDEFSVAHADRRIPMQQILRGEALEAFRVWSETPKKVPY
jgi:tRNA(Arg) A34 adenosine deaminase TadA